MDLRDSDLISFFNLVELFNRLGYITTLTNEEKTLLTMAWQIIIPDEHPSQDVGASQRNIINFL